jgi:CheY-like chemotaxis protein
MARILVIDDDNEVRGMVKRMLEREGHQVIEAADGNAGTALYRETQTDLIVTDIVMPQKDGWETIADLRRQFPDARIIAMSGGAEIGAHSYLIMGKRLGADRILEKPVRKEALMKHVVELLSR